MTRRIVFAVLALLLVYIGFTFDKVTVFNTEPFKGLMIAVTAVIGVLCTFELGNMMRRKGIRVYRRVASWGVLALLLEATVSGMQYSGHLFGVAICAAWLVRMLGKVEGASQDVSATIFTMGYVGLPLAAVVKLFLLGDQGQAWLLLSLAIIWSTDSFALFAGKLLGRHKLIPRISPGKTVEGSIGGILGALLITWAAATWFRQWFNASDLELVVFTIVLSVVGQAGDLAESLLKRDAGVKDSGSELTGHGGFLDLMDAVLFCVIPVLVYVEQFHPEVMAAQAVAP